MTGVFRRKIAARSGGKLRCLLGELTGALAAGSTNGGEQEQLPQAYDLALSHMTFHHIDDIVGTLRMLRELLKPGGRVAVFDLLKEPGSDKFHKPDHGGSVFHVGGFAPEKMTQLLQDAGFVGAEAQAVTDFQKESYQHPGQLNTFRLLMATAAAPEGT
ncbi:methyltransferase type 11 [Chlorella sorokiniana]|uniref:Methyltransferase type 11 n=1 Tax=Chlorella sorokiniana TaxID=3076 RepID=A0A2P6TI21_CHLSO|nr:methyltransferase type 11 [Chlorella sorokiniana]|eukprot:PRW33930.1 methyltransferase type 11 [Chlorella sorokiniana]